MLPPDDFPETDEPALTHALTAYFAGEATPAQRAYVDAWAKAAPDAFVAVQTAWVMAEGRQYTPRTNGFTQRLMSRLEHGANSLTQPVTFHNRATSWRNRRHMGYGFSAIIALLIVATSTVILRHQMGTRVPVATSSIAHRYTVPEGRRAMVRLDDGTRVILAAASQLDVMTTPRTVSLQGEAYFDVPPSADAPFTVRTGAVTTRVLGTAFDVRHYPHDAAVHVIVTSGKVITSGRRTSATITAGLMGHVTESTSTVTAGGIVDTAWVDGQLVFENERVTTVLAALERWYGYNFHVTDSTLGERRVRAAFKTDERIKTLAALADLLDVTITVDGATVTIQPRRHEIRSHRRSYEREQLLAIPTEIGK